MSKQITIRFLHHHNVDIDAFYVEHHPPFMTVRGRQHRKRTGFETFLRVQAGSRWL